MWPSIKAFLMDPTTFRRVSRATIAAAGGLVSSGVLPIPPEYQWIGGVIVALAFIVNAGQMNPVTSKEADNAQ